VTVVSDVSTGRHEELAIHLRMALRQGWKEDELDEVIIHLLGYVGAPLVRDAMIVAKKVYAEVAAR
jgi:4-carboxymuconolactone decarboxylase